MATRFVDARGTEWEVWEASAPRRLADAGPVRTNDRAPGLYFESATARRRLASYPQWWEALAPRDLAALCEAARPERPVFTPSTAPGVRNGR
jgi:hypothetical protein